MTETVGSNTISIGSTNYSNSQKPPETGTIENNFMGPCPICGSLDSISINFIKRMTKLPPYEYTYDFSAGCDSCQLYTTEYEADMQGGLARIEDRWNSRKKRDSSSMDAIRARQWASLERWNKEELKKHGPFTIEEMEELFNKSVFYLVWEIRRLKGVIDNVKHDNANLSLTMVLLEDQLKSYKNGEARTDMILERGMYNQQYWTDEGAQSIGSIYLNGVHMGNRAWGNVADGKERLDNISLTKAFGEAAVQVSQAAKWLESIKIPNLGIASPATDAADSIRNFSKAMAEAKGNTLVKLHERETAVKQFEEAILRQPNPTIRQHMEELLTILLEESKPSSHSRPPSAKKPKRKQGTK